MTRYTCIKLKPVLYTYNTNPIHPYLVCLLTHIPIGTRATRQQIRVIDNLDSEHVDNISDIPGLSTNENAGVKRCGCKEW